MSVPRLGPCTDTSSAAILLRCRHALERYGARDLRISSRDAPSEEERHTLNERRAALIDALQPLVVEDAERIIAQLFLLIPGPWAEEDVLRTLLRDYARLVSPYPLWALAEACRKVMNTGARFRPGAPELLLMVREQAQNAKTELAQINVLLSAKVIPERSFEERSRVLFGLRHLRANLSIAGAEAGPARRSGSGDGM